jgi:ArsR family transcriptional regulator, arsenate/arsenite/antimonite-responsive transcriptional repressor
MDRQKIERISKALGDQTRLRILEAISSRDHMNCAQIVSMRGVTPATVSHHLRILQEAGLIECQRQGQFVHSKALPQALEDYRRELSGLTGKAKKKVKRSERTST